MACTYNIRMEKAPIAVLPLDEICFPTDHRIDLADSIWWIVWRGKQAVAYAGLRPCQNACNTGLGFLCRVGVIPQHRGKGLQKRLISVRERQARRMGLTQLVTYCVPWNPPSINSLISCGYKTYRPETPWGGGGSIYFRKTL